MSQPYKPTPDLMVDPRQVVPGDSIAWDGCWWEILEITRDDDGYNILEMTNIYGADRQMRWAALPSPVRIRPRQGPLL
jgi:hypothetical protein